MQQAHVSPLIVIRFARTMMNAETQVVFIQNVLSALLKISRTISVFVSLLAVGIDAAVMKSVKANLAIQ